MYKYRITEMPEREFTKDWNDTDDEGNYLPNVMETFIGYIFIEQ